MTSCVKGNFSVLLSVYCKEKAEFLSRSLTSIWKEQTLKPNQIVLVKDGPLTAELDAEIEKWAFELGEIFTVVSLQTNVGLAAALNEGLKVCKYDLVARMDTDDISTPQRFKLQIQFMLNNPDITISSGYIEEWNSDFTIQLSKRTLPVSHEEILKFAKLRSPISHPACIYRKSVILDCGRYPDIYPEDHLLWVRVLQAGHKMANIPEVLLRMRTGEDFITRRGYQFLKGELASYKKMYESNFLSLYEFLKVSILRTVVRLSPDILKLWLYKNMR